jgi:transcriptional regulator with XRE-family HTH domain
MTFVTKSAGAVGRLREIIEESNLTQTQVAERVNIRTGWPMKQPRVSDILSSGKIRLPEIEVFAFAFDVSPGWLAFEYGEKEAEKPHPKAKTAGSKKTKRPAVAKAV